MQEKQAAADLCCLRRQYWDSCNKQREDREEPLVHERHFTLMDWELGLYDAHVL